MTTARLSRETLGAVMAGNIKLSRSGSKKTLDKAPICE